MAGSPIEVQLADALALIEVQRAQIQSLSDRVAFLEAELAKDSNNSSKPPAADPVEARKTRQARRADQRAAGRPQGKQPGAPGHHLGRREPDRTVVHAPRACGCCGADLADAVVVGRTVRQVLDIPPVRVTVTDHVTERRRCGCGTETAGVFPPEAIAPVCWGPEVRALAVYLMDRQHLPVARTAELLGEVLGAPVSTGWLCQVQQQAAGKLVPFTAALKARLGQELVLHADETGTRVGTLKYWVHTLTSRRLVLLVVHPKRGVEALKAIGVLPRYKGTVVHDGWAPYDTMTDAAHAQCHAHLVRHLRSVGETPLFKVWTDDMIGVLCDARTASETARADSHDAVAGEDCDRIETRYHQTLDAAFKALPDGPPPPRRHTGGWTVAQRQAWNLAHRLDRDADQVLALLDNTAVPADNNSAEHSLRMVKLHDKISGTFRSTAGAEAFTTIRSYLQTVALHGENGLEALHQLFTTGPWLPPPQPAPD